MARVTSVNISEKKGTVKHPVEEARLLPHHGIVGDAHAGDWHRQISLLAEAVFFASGVTTAVDAGSTGCTTYTDCWSFIQLDCVIACIFAVLLGKNIPRLCVPQLCVFLPGFLLGFSPT